MIITGRSSWAIARDQNETTTTSYWEYNASSRARQLKVGVKLLVRCVFVVYVEDLSRLVLLMFNASHMRVYVCRNIYTINIGKTCTRRRLWPTRGDNDLQKY